VAKKIGVQYDHMRIPLLGLVPESAATAPASPVNGQLWNDTSGTPNRLKYYQASSSSWRVADGSVVDANAVGTTQLQDNSVTGAKVQDGTLALTKLATDPLNRANHTGTQLRATISDFDAGVVAHRLDEFAAPTAAINLNTQKITNLGVPTVSTDAARLIDVQNAQAGIDNKQSARVATTGNITLTGTQTIDGVAVADGDRVLVKNQTTTTQNGIYLASTGAWSRTNDSLNPNTFLFVEEGTTQGDTSWMISNNGVITVGTTAIAFTQFGAAANYTAGTGLQLAGTVFSLVIPVAVTSGGTGGVTAAAAKTNLGFMTRYAADLPAIGAGTSTTVTHNLGSSDVLVQVRETSTGSIVEAGVTITGVNTLTVSADIAVGASAWHVVVIG
jgi:hypothetical protein